MNESNIFGLSARAILAIIIVCSCCFLAVWTKEIDVLKDLALMTVSFYFGQKNGSSPTSAPIVPLSPTATQIKTNIEEVKQ